MRYLHYKNGDKLPIIGLGTWKSKNGEAAKSVKITLENGYEHIDCAATYGNEAEIGEVFEKHFKNHNRQNVHITSKLWNNAHLPKDVEPALRQTLADLKLDYLDLYLMHWPVAFKPEEGFPQTAEGYLSLEEAPLIDTWNAMVDLQKKGLVKHIGVSNFSVKKLKDLISKTDYTPEVNQIEMHVYLQQPEMRSYCETSDILLTGYSPLGSADRSENMKQENEPSLFEDDTVKELANKYDVHPANILTGWHVNSNIAAIPKSLNERHIIANHKNADFTLDAKDLEKLQNLDRHYRFINGKFFELEGNSYTDIYDEQTP